MSHQHPVHALSSSPSSFPSLPSFFPTYLPLQTVIIRYCIIKPPWERNLLFMLLTRTISLFSFLIIDKAHKLSEA
jgi:hypothetical protein